MNQKSNTWAHFNRLVRLFPQRWLLIVTICAVVVMSIVEIVFAHALRGFVNSALNGNQSEFFFFLSLAGAMGLLQMVSVYIRRRMAGKYAEQGIARLRNLTAEKLSQVEICELEKNHSGDTISRMTNDLSRVRTFVTSSLVQIIFYPLAALGSFIYLIFVSWKLTLFVAFVVPLLFYSTSLVSKPIARYSKELQKRLGDVNSLAQDSISGIEVAKAFSLGSRLEKKYNQSVESAVKEAKKLAKRNAFLRGFSSVIGFMPFIVCGGLGGYWAIQGEMTAGSLIVFIQLLNYLTFPMGQLPILIGKIKSDMAAAERVYEVLDLPEERVDGTDYSINGSRAVVAFNNVSFAYDQQKVLTNLSFEVKKGETVALVGPSGSGKSTITKLIQGYYHNYTGQINLFGKNQHNWQLTGLRNNMALVAQDTYLFPGSIEENIGYGKPIATKQELKVAAKAANADSFITQLQTGYQTDVGELGDQLSGGQKQRISIARAILKDAPLLLLDEATSALDTSSEILVQEALERFMKDRTTLVIAHRLSTIRNADRILVLDQGQIVESGTHSELLEKGGLYSQLYLRQLAEEGRGQEKEVV